MTCKTCSIELTNDNAYRKDGKFRGYCKTHWRIYNKKYVRRYAAKHVEADRLRKLNQKHNVHFGGNREIVLTRDNYECVSCHMTQEEHIRIWNRSLTIDHIDGLGLRMPIGLKNNNLDNLQTLCLRCHGAKDVRRRITRRVLV